MNSLLRSALAGLTVVLIAPAVLAKPGHLVPTNLALTFKSRQTRFVSRGGVKLEGALQDFKLDVTGAHCLDVGASTGGFTDCLLQYGAAHVHGIDVGRGQLHMRLRGHSRVTFQEGVNARYLSPADVPGPFDLITVDLAFISLTRVLPVLASLLKPRSGRLLALVKPQFEVGPEAIGRRGIVKDAKAHEQALRKVTASMRKHGLVKIESARSHITGTDGNVEFFLLAKPKP